ncbi:NERD domain-containing protein [Salinimicrobium flavum]|uniref:NERD domain-containing protein n=2 Tax=Salinimicrobium flavum TaxID=1737065 RepID=A0ABW5IX61_9FLAO
MEILFLFIIFFVLSGILFYFKKNILPKIKGALGENKVTTKLRRLNKKEYIVFNNILLKKGNSTTQIDHIVVCQGGIFVIETKNYKGWIHGHQNSEYWMQTIYNYRKKFRNPIKQNWVHVFAIKKLLSEFGHIRYFPIIVFSGNAELKNVTSRIPVIYRNQLLRTIKKMNERENLSFDQVKLISDILEQHKIIEKKANKKHIKYIKESVRTRKKMERQKICPKCGNDLILRKGKYGEFYGCENYPNCTFSLNL